MTQRLTTRSIHTAEAIRDREDFTTSGSLQGQSEPTGLSHWSAGRLSGPDLERFREDCPGIRYVVFSYATPIAWYTEVRGWYKVRAKFSPTTTKHQGNLYLIEEDAGPYGRCDTCGSACDSAGGCTTDVRHSTAVH